MTTLNNYNGSIGMTGGFTPKGDQTFPLMEAHDIVVDGDGTRLDEKLNNIVTGTTNALAQKVAEDGTDINDYKTAGLYYFSGSYTYSNLPDQGNDYTYDDSSNGWLEVFTRGDYVKQIFHRHGSVKNDNCHHTYVRNYCVYDTTADTKVWQWSEWKRYCTVEELEAGSIAVKLANRKCLALTRIKGDISIEGESTYNVEIFGTIPLKGAITSIVTYSAFKEHFIESIPVGCHVSVSGFANENYLMTMYHDGTDLFITGRSPQNTLIEFNLKYASISALSGLVCTVIDIST